ncbi:helix-turn-helix transcriptional regulator [Algicella marina]|uniref:AlpA family phage regulatory protein n=1 Tax=Algicella marina TaxID=2683284 RepID=A0A6P1SW37_9RHOB|nr:AlpA family phage regulatory protein [Algicella marina]QHQ34884.1 AlpA family phage regulatory protein [Algicella marina]
MSLPQDTFSHAYSVIRRPEVEARTGLSRSSIYAKLDPKSRYHDPDFPRPVRIGVRSVAWSEREIAEWLVSRTIANRDAR